MRFSVNYIFECLFLFILSFLSQGDTIGAPLVPNPQQIRAVRFDPSYYYDANVRTNALVEQLAEKWQASGVNTVFVKVYDPAYGAKYRTKYEYNIQADYGRQDLVKYLLQACTLRDLKVMAWIPAFQHKSVWEQRPDWRVKNENRGVLNQVDGYPLCPANTEFRTWWLGFIKDLLDHYPALSGIDIGEPVVTWHGATCYCTSCRSKGVDASSVGLSELLQESVELVHGYRKLASITTVASPNREGDIYSAAEQRQLTGFDLETVLNATARPDWLIMELIWQQWAHLKEAPSLFTPEWVEKAARTVREQIGNRALVLAHLELTPFGQVGVSADALAASIAAAMRAGLNDIDLYDTHQIDVLQMWPLIKKAFFARPSSKVLICSDSLGLNDARQVASLLSHFNVQSQVQIYMTAEDFKSGSLLPYDHVFWLGVDPKFRLSRTFMNEVLQFTGSFCWINYGIDQLLQINPHDWGIRFEKISIDSSYRQVAFKNYNLTKEDPQFVQVQLRDSSNQVYAWLTDGQHALPYAVRHQKFWFFADLATSFVTEGGRYIVFADLLHDILGQLHQQEHLAMVRIEDVSPLSDPESLKKVADYLHAQDVPFSVALVPFYLDPASNTASSLSDQPLLVEAIQYMVRKGGVVVMHGSTHQYRGETTADYEFWDSMIQAPLFSDSREYVRERLTTGLEEMKRNKIYPLVWETPHYGASQLDYQVINTFFSTSYERRQTVDMHGSDQLLPYIIDAHSAGGKILPENLGYIPLADPTPGPLLQAAEHNLAIRDGIASFFFHPFIELSVLKDIIQGMKKQGYRFTDPRYSENWVKGPGLRVLSGSGAIELPVDKAFFHDFFLDKEGHVQQEFFSDSLITTTFKKYVSVPDGWIYIAETILEKPPGWSAQLYRSLASQLPRINSLSKQAGSMQPVDMHFMRAALLRDPAAQEPLARDQKNLQTALETFGIDLQIIDVEAFLQVPVEINLVFVPLAAARKLSEQQTLFLVRSLQTGIHVVLEGHSSLSRSIGIQAGEQRVFTKEVMDEYYPSVAIRWNTQDSLRSLKTDVDLVTYCSDKETGLPVVVGGEYGEGRFLFLATFFDPTTDSGYGRFPFFFEMLKNQFELLPPIRRNAVEIYFDPGTREDISIEDLIKVWRKNGVRKIYAAAWHFYPEYAYEYDRLIELAHLNAMQVYAWLELPHVSDKFWAEHPEWREKTASGLDAIVDWRKLVALDMAPCFQAVEQELTRILTSFDWDGINLAELNYESAAGLERPEVFTPMNSNLRAAFSRSSQFDPILLFDKKSRYYWRSNQTAMSQFMRYREDQILTLHRQFLALFYSLKTQGHKEWEIMVTAVANLLSPQVGQATGFNTMRIQTLSREFPFTLQIRDLPSLWPLGPDRYRRIIETYRQADISTPLVLDIEVVPLRDLKLSMAPTSQPTGLELYSLMAAATQNQSRVILNSESSLYDVDSSVLPYVLARAATENISAQSWQISTPYTVVIDLDPKQFAEIQVDGQMWPAYYRGRLILPAGDHLIQATVSSLNWRGWFQSNTKLIDLSGEMISLKSITLGLALRYTSTIAHYVIVSDPPRRLIVDGIEINLTTERGELGYFIKMPAGEHDVEIHTRDRTRMVLREASMLISGFIVMLGVTAGSFLSLMYMRNTVRRRKRRL